MNRRAFFQRLMAAAAAAPIAYSFIGTGIWAPRRNLTLLDWAKSMDPAGKVSVMAGLLAQSNDVLHEMMFKPCPVLPTTRPGFTYVRELRPGETLGDYLEELVS